MRTWTVIVALVAALLVAPARAAEPLNPYVLDVVSSYPADGRWPYAWSPNRHDDGVTRALSWRGQILARPDARSSIHCSGITYEVFVRALAAASAALGEALRAPSAALLLDLKETWYVRDGSERGPVAALIRAGLGEPVERLQDLQPGDFVQFWRNSGKGHSAVFIRHRNLRDGVPRGMEYWSAQSSSGGIGRRYVSEGNATSQIGPGQLFGVRPVLPLASR